MPPSFLTYGPHMASDANGKKPVAKLEIPELFPGVYYKPPKKGPSGSGVRTLTGSNGYGGGEEVAVHHDARYSIQHSSSCMIWLPRLITTTFKWILMLDSPRYKFYEEPFYGDGAAAETERLLQALSLTLQRENARAVLRRLLPTEHRPLPLPDP